MTDPHRGRLVAVEGIDGCGKSSQARLLADSLGAVLTAEPGATDLGRRLRALLLDPEGPERTGHAEALLMLADRAEHVHEVIAPALASGRWVVTDRYSGSTLAYQGFGRGIDLAVLGPVSAFATSGTEAALSVLVDLTPEEARRRVAASAPDRIERLGAPFQARVRRGYLTLAEADPAHWAVVDGSPEEPVVAAAVRRAVVERLGEPVGGPR